MDKIGKMDKMEKMDKIIQIVKNSISNIKRSISISRIYNLDNIIDKMTWNQVKKLNQM